MTSLRFESYIQRADDFILEKIQKLEQKRQEREYYDLERTRPRYEQSLQRAWSSDDPSSSKPPAPIGYKREFDQRAQRWYYIDPATDRAQWTAPPNTDRYQDREAVPHGRSFNDGQNITGPQELGVARERSRERKVSQSPRPGSQELEVPHQQPRPKSVSPHPSPLGRLPPGAFLDMRTGRLVTNMYPPDHPMNAH